MLKRLQWYYPMERAHAMLTFPILTLYLIAEYRFKDIILLVYGLLVCIFILWQGQRYWKLKLARLLGKAIAQEAELAYFTKAKQINRLLIALMPLVFVVQLYVLNWSFAPSRLMLWAYLANAFAIAEHINYYHRQLMVDKSSDFDYIIKNGKLKKASLAKDLLEHKF